MTILIITDTATHPVVAGNRARIVALAGLMRELGHRVECVFLPRQVHPYDEREAATFWSEGYHPYRPPLSLMDKIRYRAARLFSEKKHIKKTATPKPDFYRIDEWYRDEWTPHVVDVMARSRPDVVMVEYVYMSKVLDAVPEGVLKIIDTHDKFTDRDRIYREAGREPVFFYTRQEEEARGLKRADRVIAISSEEREFFEKISGVPSFYIPHPVEVHEPRGPESPVVGFLGSNNDINRMGLKWFLEEVWPRVKQSCPEARLRIGGSVGECIEGLTSESDLSVEVCGRVDLSEFYDSVSVVVNPLREGTGQKIKLIEALGYLKPVVTTAAGAGGMDMGSPTVCLLAESEVEFAESVVELLQDRQAREKMEMQTRKFIAKYNDHIRVSLLRILDKLDSPAKDAHFQVMR